jgi:type IV fimbrial biogenesis protein FimT
MKTRYPKGFTLYELLITLLIVGVILSYGVPRLATFTQSSRISTAANDLHSSFQLARSEAVRASVNITICASSDSMDANATCSGTLDDGLIIFVDTNGNIERDAGENVLRTLPAIDSDIDILTNGPGATYFSFAGTGLGRGDIAGKGPSIQVARLCDDRGNVLAAGGSSSARVLIVTPIGRATVLREVSQVFDQGDCP